MKPTDFFFSLKQKGLKRFFLENILQSTDSNLIKAISISLGVFIGISPFWGFQTILVLFLAVVFKLNKTISLLFSYISFPPLIPFVIYGSLKMGSYFVSNEKPLILNSSLTFADIQNNIIQYLIGSFILAAFLSLIFGLTGYFILTLFDHLKNKK